MRYELDDRGYICKVFFGCFSGNCTLYEGEIPLGYATLEEWATTANIRAYKVVEGNLTYDETRGKELEQEFANCYGINAITIGLPSNISHTVAKAWNETKIPFTVAGQQFGNKLTFENNMVKIGAGVKCVRVNANIMANGIANHMIAGITLNGTIVSKGYYRATDASYYGTIGLTPVLIKVREGDTIALTCGAGATGILTVAGGAYTYLTVEVAELGETLASEEPTTRITVNDIEQMLVSDFENKIIGEVES